MCVDGAINIVKIKSGGTGGTNGTHTGIPIRGDGSNGEVSVTITAVACYRCFSYNTCTGYSFGYIRVSDINVGGGSLTNVN